ncbi:hypothetical protein [Paenibacillus radicis (ex Xue et al. 2023)]|uniref:Uncharacterized protein n=1 Tax=Paenibacillus radicis (ex Xue et al. 2023) TaxID=2972489 RepID=A0ABT1YL75_9BACL|nr:hypothetical protein [Paenibacillus radicis (ex Xue et al. 2023)]MCR8633470.1 hypothetical protein [Paenibacillus radicis (ex Xue et al. 2023)]
MKHIVTKQVADEAGITEPQTEKAVYALIGSSKQGSLSKPITKFKV